MFYKIYPQSFFWQDGFVWKQEQQKKPPGVSFYNCSQNTQSKESWLRSEKDFRNLLRNLGFYLLLFDILSISKASKKLSSAPPPGVTKLLELWVKGKCGQSSLDAESCASGAHSLRRHCQHTAPGGAPTRGNSVLCCLHSKRSGASFPETEV